MRIAGLVESGRGLDAREGTHIERIVVAMPVASLAPRNDAWRLNQWQYARQAINHLLHSLKTFVRKAAAVLLALSFALAGCAPATLQGLREKPAGQASFEVRQNYQRVYRTVINNARRCWQTGMVTAQVVVQGDLYTDIRTAEITVALHGAVGVDTHLGIDIKAIEEDRTEIRVYYAMSGGARSAKAIERWVKDGATECSAG